MISLRMRESLKIIFFVWNIRNIFNVMRNSNTFCASSPESVRISSSPPARCFLFIEYGNALLKVNQLRVQSWASSDRLMAQQTGVKMGGCCARKSIIYKDLSLRRATRRNKLLLVAPLPPGDSVRGFDIASKAWRVGHGGVFHPVTKG